MNWIIELFTGSSIGHSIMLIAITIALGIWLGKLKVAKISLGVTWVLFVGIALSHFGLRVDAKILHFAKEFGLILFVYSIGLQVGPSFFSSLKKGGLKLNVLAGMVVLLGCVTTYIIHLITNINLATMVGVLSGAVTNTPGLGAAQQTITDITGHNDPSLASGYAVAYPLGVLGIIFTPILIKLLFKINPEKEALNKDNSKEDATQVISIKVKNQKLSGKNIQDIISEFGKPVVITRIKHIDGSVSMIKRDSIVELDDTLLVVIEQENAQDIINLLGEKCNIEEQDWETEKNDLVSRRIVVTKSSLNGQKLSKLNIRSLYGVHITRVYRAEIELIATKDLQLQLGDRVTVVGTEENISKVADLLGNSLKRLNHPNLIPIFFGIFLGIIVGSIPFLFPGIPQPVKLGLAGGPLIVAILIGRYGPGFKMVTYTTQSANMMIREIGIALFLAAVGLEAGENFIETIVNGGYMWILYGLLITVIPLFIVGVISRVFFKMDYYTIIGMLAGSTTDPPALAFANSVATNDAPSVAYATVYPLTMFLRVLTAQILIIIALG